MKTQTHRERKARWRRRQRGWSGAAVGQGPPESVRGKEEPEGVWPYQRLDFQLLASRTENKFLPFEFVMAAPGN